MRVSRYATPEAFKQSLETRLRRVASETLRDLTRIRQRLVFDRFLARVFAQLGDRVIVKGGVVLELRLARARMTRDVDLRTTGDPAEMIDALVLAGRRDLGDFLMFLVRPDPDHPTIEGEGLVYGGRRFRVEGQLAGKPYGLPFGVDAGVGDALLGEPDVLEGSRLLEFAGVAPAALRVYPRETHIAEKLHAYTLPRQRENSRVKDLPDLALLAQTGAFDADTLRRAIERTFHFRGTHQVPNLLPVPPTSWDARYDRMARVDSLPWSSIDVLVQAVRAFMDPVLHGEGGRWDPATWRWEPTKG